MLSLQEKKPYFKNLDSLRFFAAFFVILGHCIRSVPKIKIPLANSIINSFLDGALWVSFFFVLSGFLIGYLIYVELKEESFSPKKFLIRRALRIWPLFYAVIFLAFFIFPILRFYLSGILFWYPSWWKFIFFGGNYVILEAHKTGNDLLAPHPALVTWSIAVEEQFYILISIIILFVKQKYLIIVTSCIAIFGIGYLLLIEESKSYLHSHTFWSTFDFFIGITLGLLFAFHQKCRDFVSRNRIYLKWFIISVVIALLLMKDFSVSYNLIKISYVTLFAIIIIYAIYSSSRFFNAIGNNVWLSYFGKISYGIYLWHSFVQYPLNLYSHKYFGQTPSIQKELIIALLTVVITLIIAHLSFKYFESYFLKLKSKFY